MLRSALLALAIGLISQLSLHGQDHGEFSGVDIIRPPSSTQFPELFMKDDVLDRHASLKLTDIGLEIKNDQLLITAIITHDSPSHAFMIKKQGIGVGTYFPQSALHIASNGTAALGYPEANIILDNRHTTAETRTMFQLINNGPSRFEFENTKSDEIWSFQTNKSDNFMINRLGSGGNEFSIRKNGMVTMGPGGTTNFILQPNGNLEILGSISQSSDRNQKTAIEDLDIQQILAGVNRLPISSWQYKDDQSTVRHIGPMAQDFHYEFSVGTSDKTLSSIDTSGVALAAIQALSQRLEERDKKIEQLESAIAEIQSQVGALSQ